MEPAEVQIRKGTESGLPEGKHGGRRRGGTCLKMVIKNCIRTLSPFSSKMGPHCMWLHCSGGVLLFFFASMQVKYLPWEETVMVKRATENGVWERYPKTKWQGTP